MNDFLTRHAEKERQLFDQFDECQVVEITGVLGRNGVVGSKSYGDIQWTFMVSFDAVSYTHLTLPTILLV